VYLTGTTRVNSVNGFTTVAYRAGNGHEIWLRRHVLNASFIATSIAASPNGRTVFVTEDDNGAPGLLTVAYNAASGATAWTARHGMFASGSDGISVAVSPGGGRVFVAATSDANQGGPGPVLVFAYNSATGAKEWISQGLGGSQLENSSRALAVSPDGSTVFVIMTQDGGVGASANSVTTAYNAATGAPRWSANFPSPPSPPSSTISDVASAVAVNPDGKSVYVTVNTVNQSFNPTGFTTIGYGAGTGTRLWATSDDGSASRAFSVAVSAGGGTVFAAGSSHLGLRMEFTTIAYRA
jgi:hypothetical protein